MFVFRSYSQQKKKRKKKERNKREDKIKDRTAQLTEPPDVKLYGDPNYWTQTYGHAKKETEEKDNTKPKHGISHKIKWDGKAESFQDYDRLIQSHCQQSGLGYYTDPTYGTRVCDKAPRYQKPPTNYTTNCSMESYSQSSTLISDYKFFTTQYTYKAALTGFVCTLG
jgi:hypothetical protein